MSSEDLQKQITQLHEQACLNKQDVYIDPATGYSVFTRYYHLKRGTCCKSGCRHCPWSYKKEAADKKSKT